MTQIVMKVILTSKFSCYKRPDYIDILVSVLDASLLLIDVQVCFFTQMGIFFMRFIMQARFVSIPHLDVYKRQDLTDEQGELLEIWDDLNADERRILMNFVRTLKK